MILELDYTNKTIKVKGKAKLSDIIEFTKKLDISDWNIEQEIEYRESINIPWIQTEEPYEWWKSQPYYNHEWVIISDTNSQGNIKTTLTVN